MNKMEIRAGLLKSYCPFLWSIWEFILQRQFILPPCHLKGHSVTADSSHCI